MLRSATLRPVEGTGGGSRPLGYKINYRDLGEGSKRRRRIIGEELEPAGADAVREAVSRVLKVESLRGIAFDFNARGIQPAGGKRNGEVKIDKWQGAALRRVLLSHKIGGLREHNGEVVGSAVWPEITGASENPDCQARVRIGAEPPEAYIEGYVIDQ